ncbi:MULTISPECIES: glutathione S-transferase C-terminal domain-containing protein [Colwellia]|uniref:Metaxin glutathione S-transferase domain-containing protein n=1 Tax=Colwellia marinimaniae TaxID=1513592 RepID=A0ABQ0MQR6_9GAMM|nr:glutathione S-transferase C-terminal domain-containing protein [Colwellia sp. MT2012]GAW94712.1 hypothetical protein MTCD1_00309 [Colwellia marinimaniae]
MFCLFYLAINTQRQQSHFYGTQLSSFDATAYAILCQFISVNCEHDFNRKARSYPNLMRYCQRIE